MGGGGGGPLRATDFNLFRRIAAGNFRGLTQTDPHHFCDKVNKTNSSYYYKQIDAQFVGNYENWVPSQPVKDWSVATSKSPMGLLKVLIADGQATRVWEVHPVHCWALYGFFFLW